MPNTATHYCLRPGYEGPCCLDCAAAVGGERRELRRGEAGYGEPCTSCVEMARDAEHDEGQAAEEQRAQDEAAELQRVEHEREELIYSAETSISMDMAQARVWWGLYQQSRRAARRANALRSRFARFDYSEARHALRMFRDYCERVAKTWREAENELPAMQ